MENKDKTNRWSWIAGILCATAAAHLSAATPYNYAVQASATATASPASISLSWPGDSGATSYVIKRKAKDSSTWTTVATLPGSSSSWTDSAVAAGTTYEYSFTMPSSGGFTATGYVYAGVNATMVEGRGKILLVVDSTYAAQLAVELSRLQQDLVGDGWTVVRRDVARTDSPPTVKNVIKSEYNNGGLRTVLLFGHVAVPYSGNLNPDGHPDHVGAWPADVYYADMDGTWTDSSVNNTSGAKPWNHNVPGDGKFDQTEIPSDLELEVGRVDLANMTCFSNKTPSRSELDLLRQYLNKDHNFRHGKLVVQRRGSVADNFGIPYGEAFAAAGWRLSGAFFGAQNTTAIPSGGFFPTLSANSHLFSYACGGGSYYTCAGVGGSDDFANYDIKAVFTLFLGSYFGDWDNESNFLRAPLGGSTHTLTSGWSGRPEWWLHHMGLGETIGYGTKLTQNNRQGGIYSPQYQGTRQVHISLHGDPTLRLHPVLPPAGLQGVTTGSSVTLTWSPSPDSNIQGYHVYRGTSANGPFTRLTASTVNAFSHTDSSAPAGAVYMVRAVKLETSGSGTYLNPSQGLFYNSSSTGGGPTPPTAPSSLVAAGAGSSQITLGWADNSTDETGFRIERKTGAAGAYSVLATTAPNVTAFTDTGLAAGTQYYYRVAALNAAGASAALEANATTAAGSPVNAAATFVQVDSATQGSWKGVYGADGSTIMGDTAALPAYVAVTPTGHSSWTWNSAATETRALQRINAANRIAAAWFQDGSFTVNLNFTDGQTHRVAMYFLDWDNNGRTQTVEILDAGTGAVLNSQTISGFGNGKYLVWDLKGSVRARFTKVSGYNAVLNGLFFGPAPANPGVINQTATAHVTGSNIAVRIAGSPGQTFEVYSSPDLGTWTLAATVTLTGSSHDYVEGGVPGNAAKYYRAVPQ